MITLAAYFILNNYSVGEWSGWLLVLPVFLDLSLINRVGK